MNKSELMTLARNLGVRRTARMNTTQLRDAIKRQRAWLATPAADIPKTGYAVRVDDDGKLRKVTR